MMDYTKHMHSPAVRAQDTYVIDNWKRAERFLILGSEGGTFYVGERKLTQDNAKWIVKCIEEDPERMAQVIRSISMHGRAPKAEPALFALALMASNPSPMARAAAWGVFLEVVRTGTHLFHFVDMLKKLGRINGRRARRALGSWYTSKSERDLIHQVLKYRQRDGMSHKDVLRLCHVANPSPVLRWAVAGAEGMSGRSVNILTKTRGTLVRGYPCVQVPEKLHAFEQLQNPKRSIALKELITRYEFTHEMLPTEEKRNPEAWEWMLPKMGTQALVRNLGVMTANGLLKPLSNAVKVVCEKLENPQGIHPIALFSALRVYARGHGDKGKLVWQPVPAIIDALDEAFYKSFGLVESTGLRTLLAIDVSGSMQQPITGLPGVQARDAALIMAMVTARVEPHHHILAFSHKLVPLIVTTSMRLDDMIKVTAKIPFGSTDCSAPMAWASENGVSVDSFGVYTDSETNSNRVPPSAALRRYSQSAKLAVVAMTASNISIADPNDAGMLDVVGFDTFTPNVLADFFRDQ